jgi:hypothetical protein
MAERGELCRLDALDLDPIVPREQRHAVAVQSGWVLALGHETAPIECMIS